MHIKFFVSLSLAAVLAGCASTPPQNVVPLAGGKYEVSSESDSKDGAMRKALGAAESTCKARQLRHVVLSQSESYKGMVSEGTNKAVNAAAQVLATVSGSWVPTLSGDDDYSVKLTFTCEQ